MKLNLIRYAVVFIFTLIFFSCTSYNHFLAENLTVNNSFYYSGENIQSNLNNPAFKNTFTKDILIFEKGLFYRFYYNGERLSYREVKSLLKDYPAATKKLKKGRMFEIFGGVFVLSGIILTSSTTLEVNSGGGVSVNTAALVGLGCFGITAIFVNLYGQNYEKATNLFNDSVK